MNKEMRKGYAQVGVEDFFRLCMSGPSVKSLEETLPSSTFKGLDKTLNFDDVPTNGKEAPMYAPLVSKSTCDTSCKLTCAV